MADPLNETSGPRDHSTQLAPPSVTAELEHNPTSQDTTTALSDTSNGADHDEKKVQPPHTVETVRSRGKTFLIMLSLCLAVFLAAIDVTIVTTAVPSISEYFGSASGYTWIGSAYLLGAAASTPIWGKLSDIWGRKPVLLAANAVFFIGSLLAGVATSIGMLIAARAIQGLGGGGLIVLVNICIGDLFSPRRRGAYYAMIGAVWAIASSCGPIIGGVFSQEVTWRWCFYINLPIDGVAFILIIFCLDIETPKTALIPGLKAIDWLGSFFIVAGTLLFLYGIENGGVTYAWDSATTVCIIVFGVLTIGLFLLIEWKVAKYPLMPMRIFQYRSNVATLLVCFFHGFVFMGVFYYMPLYFQVVRGATPILSGAYVLASSAALSVGSLGTGIYIRKSGLYIPPIYVSAIMTTLGVGLFIDFDRTSAWSKLILFQLVVGFGIGPNFQAPLIALQSLVAPRDIATATSTFSFLRNIATSISVVVGQVVLQNQMLDKQDQLVQIVGPAVAAEIGGANVGASAGQITRLPFEQRIQVQDLVADSLQPVWIVYTAFSAAMIVLSAFVTKQTLLKTHEVTKTGLEEEEKNRLEAKAGRDVQAINREAAEAERARKHSKDIV